MSKLVNVLSASFARGVITTKSAIVNSGTDQICMILHCV